MGRTLAWYDGPVAFEISSPVLMGLTIGNIVPDFPGWINTTVAVQMDEGEKRLASCRRVDLRMLMTRPEASLWRVDFASGGELTIAPILDPLPDAMLPDPGMFLDDLYDMLPR